MTKYLYGAAVQGIQSFIFQTSKLREIIGASELVEQICTNFFKTQVGQDFKDDNLILGAAGNIKYVFDDFDSCQRLVTKFPKSVMEMAPGITISQAVVKVEEGKDVIQELERRLRIQRNKSVSITDGVGLMITETARKTGGIGFKYEKDSVIDRAQHLKRKESENANIKLQKKITDKTKEFAGKFPFDIEEIVKGGSSKSWIAVIHADGNNLGQKIMKMGNGYKEQEALKALRKFSAILNEVTEKAAKKAFELIVANAVEEKIPFRPVILGGDDLTAIIRGDLALDYTKVYLEQFESLSKIYFKNFEVENNLKENPFKEGLTACAGIAYIKASYPFHYGVKLAEKLCQQAKNVFKNLNREHSPSSLMFHKVHASFVEEYEDIIEKELKASDNVYFNFGPYFISPQTNYSTVLELQKWLREIKAGPKAGLRNWLSELRYNPHNAEQTLERIAHLNPKYTERLPLKNPFTKREIKENGNVFEGKFTPIFDIISLSSIQE